ncbi:MAG: DUF934 domain-containing protein [Myxococcales bacterium]|nr:DUF934 domain-containing protein [Myxococcales bacterium]
MPVFNGEIVQDDAWTHVEAPGEVPLGGMVTVSLERWLALDDREGPNRWGVRLSPEDDPMSLRDTIEALAIIVLEVPKFKDGRVYSQAVLLRRRLGYRAEIRASGHIIPDQFAFLRRCGVDTVFLAELRDVEAWQRNASRFRAAYQASVRGGPIIHRARAEG